MGKKRGIYRVLVGRPDKKRLFGRPGSKWEDIIESDLQGVAGGMDWIDLGQERDGWPDIVDKGIN